MSDRSQARLAFAESALATTLEMAPASADASFRSYWRVRDAYGQTHIVMDAPPAREDCKPFIDICARLDAADLSVPRVLAQDLTQGFLLLPDLGTRMLLPELHPGSVQHHYQHAMAIIVRMQTAVSSEGLPHYDAPRLDAEMELFPEWFLRRHLGVTPSCEEFDVIEATMMQLRNLALTQPKVFVHRDFHARNLMLTEEQNQPFRALAVLDFQDAVCGPITYDLVSLLRDCYIAWPQAELDRWLEDFRLETKHLGLHNADNALFTRWFDWMGVQRHLKVLGIFARLNYRDGKAGYLQDLPLVLRYTLEVCARYPELAAFARWLTALTHDADLTKVRRLA